MNETSADAFGNALGNSIVRASQSSGTVTTGGAGKATQIGREVYEQAIASGQSEQQATVAAARAIAAETGGAVNISDEVAARIIAENSFDYDPNETFQLSNGVDTGIINFGDPSNIDYTLSGIASFLASGNTTAAGFDLGLNFARTQILGNDQFIGKFGRDATFVAAANRGAAALRIGVRNANTGIDANALVRQQTAGYTEFRQAQRSQFNDFYNGLSFNQRQAFDGGINLFGAVIDYGQAIADSAKYALDLLGVHGTEPQAKNINLIKDDLRTAGNIIGQVPSFFGDEGVVRFSVERNFFNKS